MSELKQQLEYDLYTAITKNDEETVRILLKNRVDLDVISHVIIPAYDNKNSNIIGLLFEYANYDYKKYELFDTYEILINELSLIFNIGMMGYKTDIEAKTIIDSVIDNYKNNNVLDEVIKHDPSNIIISSLNDVRQDRFKYRYSFNEEMYRKIKEVLEQRLFSLIFRSCALKEVDELRTKLHNLGINEIDGKPINGIKSETDLCDLIESGLKVDIHKYDTFDYTKIKVAVRDDNDDENI